MKKLFSYITLATLLFATSCSDKEEYAGEGDGTVTFSLQLPDGVATRAIGDGTTAKDLTYAVYESGETTPVITGEKGTVKFDENLTATVSLRLVTGKTYDFIFFADATEGSPYTFNEDSQTVTVSYDGVVSNDEKRDAFFAARTGLKVDRQINEEITLKRPFAQLNVGTNDLADAVKAGLVAEDMTTQMVAPSYSAWNLKTREVEGEASDVTFAFAARPDDPSILTLKEDNSQFAYLSMNYLLAKSDKELINCTFTVKEGETVLNSLALTSVPVQRNYRTNIVGAILTSQADFTIIIDPIFDGEYVHEIVNDAQFAAAAATPNAEIKLDPQSTFTMPTDIADGVTVEGSGATIVVPYNDQALEGEGITFSNVTLMTDATTPQSSNGVVTIAGDVTFDNVTIKNGKTSNGIYVNNGKLTLKNTDMSDTPFGRSIYSIGADSEVVLENCIISDRTTYAFNGNGTLTAIGCTFQGWMSGWHVHGTFKDCTFTYGKAYYPAAICYGTTVFENCKFAWTGSAWTDENATPLAGTTYGYNYQVSCGSAGITITITGCTYVGGDKDGQAVDKALFVRKAGDGKQDPDKVIIDGTEYAGDDSEFVMG